MRYATEKLNSKPGMFSSLVDTVMASLVSKYYCICEDVLSNMYVQRHHSKGLFRSSTPIKKLADVLNSPIKKMTGFSIDLC